MKSFSYNPDTFKTFHFNQYNDLEKYNKDLKILLDRHRVYTLLSFKLKGVELEKVEEEIKKVDFKNVEKKYYFYYKMPRVFVKTYWYMRKFISTIKKSII